jgi:hypothetical protein
MREILPSMTHDTFAPFVVLRAQNTLRGESLNVGIVLFTPQCALVAISQDVTRIKALHPDFGAVHLAQWASQLQTALERYAQQLSVQQQIALLPLLASPFVADSTPGTTKLNLVEPQETLLALMAWQVDRQKVNVRAIRKPSKKPTRLSIELRQWLKQAKAFSTKIEDLGKHRVVANYPIAPAADLYADLALMNGQLHLIEIMDLRGMDKLSAATRGEAALKCITLDEAKAQGNTVAVLAASDYGVAKPAISLLSRYAHEVFDLGAFGERERFAAFIGRGLHRPDLLTPTLMAV